MTTPFTTEIHPDGVAEVVLNQPPVNALNAAGWHALAQTIHSLGQQSDVRVIVIRAEGRGVCAGVDIKELNADLGIAPPDHGCLLPWARQGVLLLNAVLTVEEGRAGAHQGKGWEGFTDHAIETLAREREGLVFLLWGSYAQAKGKVIDTRRHRVLRAPHPSPLSAHRGFLGCGHFGATNQYLAQRGLSPIDWRLPPRDQLVL